MPGSQTGADSDTQSIDGDQQPGWKVRDSKAGYAMVGTSPTITNSVVPIAKALIVRQEAPVA